MLGSTCVLRRCPLSGSSGPSTYIASDAAKVAAKPGKMKNRLCIRPLDSKRIIEFGRKGSYGSAGIKFVLYALREKASTRRAMEWLSRPEYQDNPKKNKWLEDWGRADSGAAIWYGYLHISGGRS
jgi:hypothetical protein